MVPRMLRSIIAIAVFVACANALHISRHQSSDLAQEARQKGSALAPADHRFQSSETSVGWWPCDEIEKIVTKVEVVTKAVVKDVKKDVKAVTKDVKDDAKTAADKIIAKAVGAEWAKKEKANLAAASASATADAAQKTADAAKNSAAVGALKFAGSGVSSDSVCAEMEIPLVGDWVTLNLGLGMSLTEDADGNAVLTGFVGVGLSIDLCIVTIQIGIKGTMSITLQLPPGMPVTPISVAKWAIKTIIHDMIEESKFAKYITASPSKAVYIQQVVTGVAMAELISKTTVTSQELSDAFAEMFHNYILSMQYRCDPTNVAWFYKDGDASENPNFYESNKNYCPPVVSAQNDYMTGTDNGGHEFRQVDVDDGNPGANTLKGTVIKQDGACGIWELKLAEAITNCTAMEECVAFSWNPNDFTLFYSSTVDGSNTRSLMSGGHGWASFSKVPGMQPPPAGYDTIGDYNSVFLDARRYAIAKAGKADSSNDDAVDGEYAKEGECESDSKECVNAYMDFMAGHFSLTFFGVPFDYANGNFLDHSTIDCSSLDGKYYYNVLRKGRVNIANVTLAAVAQASVRLCYFMATGVLVPKGENKNSLFYPSEHKNKNMVDMLTILMPSLFPAYEDATTDWLQDTLWQERDMLGLKLKAMGPGGNKLSTFHHMMAILSGSPWQIMQQLTKYVTDKAAKDGNAAQSCGAGLKKVTGAVALTVSAGASSGGGFCASKAPKVSVGVSISASLSAEKTAPCSLGKWAMHDPSFFFKVQLPTITVPFTGGDQMSIAITGHLATSGSYKVSVKFSELIPDPPAPPKDAPAVSPFVQALKAGFANAQSDLQPLVQACATAMDYKSAQKKSKGELLKMFLKDLVGVGYTVVSTYMDAKIDEEAKKYGCKGKVCTGIMAEVKSAANAGIQDVIDGKNATEMEAQVVGKVVGEVDAVKAAAIKKFESFKADFTPDGFKAAMKKEGDTLIDDLAAKIAAAAIAKAESLLPAEVIKKTFHSVELVLISNSGGNATFTVNYVEKKTIGAVVNEPEKGGVYESKINRNNLLTLTV